MADSDPPDGIIDARTPLASNGTTRLGISDVVFYFDRLTNCTAPEHFTVEQEGGGQPPPQAAGVQQVSGNGLKVLLSSPLEPRSWTTITHGPTQSALRFGYLPGDVNADGVSGPIDILELVDSLNGVAAPQPLWSGDLDRSGVVAPADIIMLVDLLNGVGNLDAYNGARLP